LLPTGTTHPLVGTGGAGGSWSSARPIKAIEIKLERIPVENLAEVTETLDRVRVSAQKLVSMLAEATEKYVNGEINGGQFSNTSSIVGDGLKMLDQGMKIVLKRRHDEREVKNSGKRRPSADAS
jgi:hypothetical protein